MSIASYCRRPAVSVGPDETLLAAAQRMEKEGVGLLLVVRGERLAGVLSDRDVALTVGAQGREAREVRVAEAMTRSPVCVDRAASLEDTLARMSRAQVRRLPVVHGDRVLGVVSADDLFLLLAREIGGLGEVLVSQLPAGSSRTLAGEGEEEAPPPALRRAEHYLREVVTAETEAPVGAVARDMDEHAVGSVVVVGADQRAAGVLTDRDIVLRVVAKGLDPARTSVSAVMSAPVIAAEAAEPLEEVVARMRTAGVRRIPVLEAERVVGMVSFDDLLVGLGQELSRLSDCVAREIRGARHRSYPTRMRHEIEQRMEEAATRLRDVGDQTLRGLGREVEQALDRVAHAMGIGGGRGRGAAQPVYELMSTDVHACTPDDPLSTPARIMWEHDCGCVPVVSSDGSGHVVGMITDRDICMALFTRGGRLAEMQVESAMAHRVFCCRPADSVADAEAIMRSARVRRLPVVDEHERLRGLLSLADIAEAAAGRRAPSATAVGAEEVALVLEAVCRPRSSSTRR